MNIKKITKIVLAFILMFGMQIGIKSNVKAAGEALNYFENEEVTFNGTADTVQTKTEGLETIKNADSFTITTKFKTSDKTKRIHNLFFVGNEAANKANNYVNMYLSINGKDATLGVELRNGSNNDHTSVKLAGTYNDNEYHTYAFTVEHNVGYALYVDGKLVKKVAKNPTRFIKGSIADATYLSFGGGKRAGANSYYANGTMKSAHLYNNRTLTASEIADDYISDAIGGAILYSVGNVGTQQEISQAVSGLTTTSFSTVATYRYESPVKHAVLSLSSEDGKSVTAFVDPTTNKVGLAYDDKEVAVTTSDTLFTTDKWYSVAYVVDSKTNKLIVYVDQVKVGEADGAVGLNQISNLNKVNVGISKKAGIANLNGHIERAAVFGVALDATIITALQDPTNYVFEQQPDPESSYSTEEVRLFHDNYKGARKYRIPSLLTTSNGTVLAAIDKRNQHAADWGNIDTFLRRSVDGGKNWDEGKVILDLADNEAAGTANSAFLIDPSMVEDKTNHRIFMLLDMFPESQGFFSIQKGTDFEKVGEKYYQKLHTRDRKTYTIREEGNVYDENGTKTDYKVTVTAEAPYKALGDLYQNGEKVGNVYLQTGPLTMVKTSHLWLIHSDDEGQTWSQPKDITPQVKEEWMKFMGTGPGVGIQLKNNRLVFPVYYTNYTGNKQSSAVIYSDDNGETWHRGESPNDGRVYKGKTYNSQTLKNSDTALENTESQVIQLNNGDLKLFMRSHNGKVMVATSKDNGQTWENTLGEFTDLADPYCQLSVIHYGDVDGKEIVVFSNPNAKSRSNGTLRVGEVNGGDITWTHSQVVTPGAYAYSSITKLPNGHIGVLYEGEGLDINYKEVDLNWIKAPLVNKPVEAPIALNATVLPAADGCFYITVDYSQNVLVAENAQVEFQAGGQTLTARYYQGSGTNQITYQLPITGNETGVLTMHAYTGVIEGVMKHAPTVYEEELYDFDIIPVQHYTVTTNNNQDTQGAENVIDSQTNTLWHTKWDKSEPTPHTLTIELDQVYKVDGYYYLPRQDGTNGIITQYKIEVSTDNVTYTKVKEGSWKADKTYKKAQFTPIDAKYVRLVSVEGEGGFSAAAEVRLHQSHQATVDKTTLQAGYDQLVTFDLSPYRKAGRDALTAELTAAKAVLDDENATQQQVANAMNKITDAINALVEREPITKEGTSDNKTINATYLEETFADNAEFNVRYSPEKSNTDKDVYELSFSVEGAKVQPVDGGVLLAFPIKENREVEGVYHVESDNSLTKLNHVIKDNKVSVLGTAFSDYVVNYIPLAAETDETTAPSNDAETPNVDATTPNDSVETPKAEEVAPKVNLETIKENLKDSAETPKENVETPRDNQEILKDSVEAPKSENVASLDDQEMENKDVSEVINDDQAVVTDENNQASAPQDAKETKKAVHTNDESQSGYIALLGFAVAGLLLTRKRK